MRARWQRNPTCEAQAPGSDWTLCGQLRTLAKVLMLTFERRPCRWRRTFFDTVRASQSLTAARLSDFPARPADCASS